MKRKGENSIIVSILIPIIIFVIIIVFLFMILKASSYDGRLQARFGYALAGSISILVNRPAQIVQSYSTDALVIVGGITAAVFILGGLAGASSLSSAAEELTPVEEEGAIGLDSYDSWESDIGGGQSNSGQPSFSDYTKTFFTGGGGALKKLVGNPIYQDALGASLALFALSSLTNDIASKIQSPILNYLAPEGVYFVGFNNLNSNDLNPMYQNLNNSYAKYIEQNYCNNPQSPECENIFLTYLIAQDLYYTWGETLGQSVAIAGSHDEYFIGYYNYSAQYPVTQQGVLCMLGMMDYFGQSPLEQMYNINLTTFLNDISNNYDGDLVCGIAYLKIDGGASLGSLYCGSTNAGIPQVVTQEDVFVTYEISSNSNSQNQLSLYTCPSGNTHNDYNIIIPDQTGQYFAGYIQYLYDGGTEGVIVSSVFGQIQNG